MSVGDKKVSEIQKGLVVYLCAQQGDAEQLCAAFAEKLVKLRIFGDEQGKMNLSVRDVGGQVLLVSQFTLAAELKGNRPSFSKAEQPERAKQLYLLCADEIAKRGVEVKRGMFGADMTISQRNCGPVTIIWESK